MNYIKPEITCNYAFTFQGGLQLAEFAGRLCYKSENNIEPGSEIDFLKMIIEKGHTSILEHCPLYFEGDPDYFTPIIIDLMDSPLSRKVYEVPQDGTINYRIYSNLRVLINLTNGKDIVNRLLDGAFINFDKLIEDLGVKWFIPKLDDRYIRYGCYIKTQRSIVDELVRERIQSSAVESTRWIDYSSDNKTQNLGIQWCLPHWVKEKDFDRAMCNFKKEIADIKTTNKLDKLYEFKDIALSLYMCSKLDDESLDYRRALHYLYATIQDELLYNEARENLLLPAQDAREYLFLGVKSEMYYSGYYEDWLNIIDKRLYDKFGKAHPNMHIIMKMCLDHINTIRNNGE